MYKGRKSMNMYLIFLIWQTCWDLGFRLYNIWSPASKKCVKVSSNSILGPTYTLILSSHAGGDLPYLSTDWENKDDPYYSKMHFTPRADSDAGSVSQAGRRTDRQTGPEKSEKREGAHMMHHHRWAVIKGWCWSGLLVAPHWPFPPSLAAS